MASLWSKNSDIDTIRMKLMRDIRIRAPKWARGPKKDQKWQQIDFEKSHFSFVLALYGMALFF